jgi:hypothetical protein
MGAAASPLPKHTHAHSASLPSKLRAFLNVPSREIDGAIDYYQGLMEVLNELSHRGAGFCCFCGGK